MKLYKIIFSLALASFAFIGCKNNETKKEEVQKKIVTANTKELALNISGMTCEIGCAKFIQSKLSKEVGVLDAKVIFNDSTAVVKYDASKTNKASLLSLVNGLADNMYTATEGKIGGSKKACDADGKKDCCKDKKVSASGEKACDGANKKDCCKEKEVKQVKACAGGDCKKDCCGESNEAKVCAQECKKECCATT